MAENENEKQTKEQVVHSAYGPASAAEVRELLQICWDTKMALIIFSAPGCGKSSLVAAFAKDHGVGMECLIGSQMDSTDFSGLPMGTTVDVNGDAIKATTFGAPDWQIRLLNGQSKILFLDEFSNSPSSVQAAELKLIGDRRFANGEQVPDDVLIVLASNPVSSSVDAGGMLAPPMASRLLQISMEPTAEEFYKGLVNGWDDEPWEISDDERKHRERVVSFLRANNGTYICKEIGDDFDNMDTAAPSWMNLENESSESEREIMQTAWPCPRSWDNVCRMLGRTGFESEISPLQERILSGTVGRQAAVYLVDYAHEHAHIDPYELIRNPEMQNWRVSDEGVEFNEIAELARAVNEAAILCDGKDGRPTPMEALNFYDKVIDLGGGSHFVEFAQGRNEKSPGHYFKRNIPADVDRREWTTKIYDILRKFKDHGYIPDTNKEIR